MVSAKDIQHIHPEKRNCFFPNEGQLAFYEEYSLTNCRLECAILEVQKRLGCIPWFLPKVWESCYCSHNSLRGIQSPSHPSPISLLFCYVSPFYYWNCYILPLTTFFLIHGWWGRWDADSTTKLRLWFLSFSPGVKLNSLWPLDSKRIQQANGLGAGLCIAQSQML